VTVRVFINGFGRIGRNVLRAIAPFGRGTFALAKAAVRLTQAGKLLTVAGGGDTLAALAAADVTDSFSHVSTAGGAVLEWLEGRDLPGVAILRTSNS
jgi:phosphoglycerate kinase